MHLGDVLRELQTGDILCFQGTRLHSRFIRWWTGSRYSHVAIVIVLTVAGQRTVCAFEALEGAGVRLVPLEHYLAECAAQGCRVDWYAVDDPSIDRELMVSYCLSVWGERYSSLLQFVWSFGRLSRWLHRVTGHSPMLDPSRPFCSWVAAGALIHAGYRFADDLEHEPAYTTPGDVSRFRCLTCRGELTP